MNKNYIQAVKSSILAFISGDCTGLNLIFIPKKILEKSDIFELIKNGTNSRIPYGVWSDDSSMTLCTIKSTLDSNGINLEDISKKFISWFENGYMTPYDKAFDIGRTTFGVISNRKSEILEGINNIKHNGNGSLMRILPVSLYCYFNKIRGIECFNLIKQVSSLTHAHPISILGCYIYTTVVFNILEGLDKSEILSDLKNIHLKIPKEYKHWLKEYDFSNLNINLNPSGYVANSLKVSLWGFINSDSIKCCISNIAKLSGDMDTNCAIGASLSGLYYGLRGEILELDKEIVKKDMILRLVDEFAEAIKIAKDKIKEILEKIENAEIFLEDSYFIQKPSYDEILNCIKDSKEIIYKKINIDNFKEEIEKIPDVKTVLCIVRPNPYSDLSEVTNPLGLISDILDEKNIKFFGWDVFEDTENYQPVKEVYCLIVK